MWRIFVVSLLLPSGALAISSHSPLDLLAYPAYSVKLSPGYPIANSTAERILRESKVQQDKGDQHDGAHEESQDLIAGGAGLQVQRDGSADADIFGHADSSADAQAERQLMGHPKPYLLRSSANGQAYLCTVPQREYTQEARGARQSQQDSKAAAQRSNAPLTKDEKAQQALKNEQDKKEAYDKGLALLEPLKGGCLYLTQGWFTYAFCYGSEIRQFHAIKNPNPTGPPLIEDLTQDAYTLGLWTARLTQNEGLVNIKKGRALGTLREILESEDKADAHSLQPYGSDSGSEDDAMGNEKRYLVQRWTGGTLCDKTGVDRSVEVQFHCNSQSSDRIFLIRETAICEYVIVIHTPRLCGESIFLGGSTAAEDAAERKRKEVNVIECRPVIKDELYLEYTSHLRQEQSPLPLQGLPQAAQQDQVRHTAQEDTPHEAPASEQQEAQQLRADNDVSEGAPDEVKMHTGPKNTLAEDSDGAASQLDTPTDEAEEIVDLGSYVLAFDAETGEMSVTSEDGADNLDLGEALSGKQGMEGLSTEEAKAMKELLKTFRESLESMMGDMAEGITKKPTVSQGKGDHELGSDSDAKGDQQPKKPEQKRLEPLSRLTRSGAHSHRELAEKYLQGKLGSSRRTKGGVVQTGATDPQEDKMIAREAAQRQMGTPQFRNLKRAFEQRWDREEAEEGKEQSREKVVELGAGNVPPRDEL